MGRLWQSPLLEACGTRAAVAAAGAPLSSARRGMRLRRWSCQLRRIDGGGLVHLVCRAPLSAHGCGCLGQDGRWHTLPDEGGAAGNTQVGVRCYLMMMRGRQATSR